MKKLLYLIGILCLIVPAGCKKFSEFQTNPNQPTQATPDLLLNTVEQGAFQVIDRNIAFACRQLVYTDAVSSYQYYTWQRGSFSAYDNLRQVLKMQEEATRLGKPEYIPLVKFFKAYYIMQLTLAFGDVPDSQALLGESGNYTPGYDLQQDLFLSALNDLDDANSLITSNTASVQGDIVYNGNMQQWRQLINTFSLRILMDLSAKENNTTLNVRQRFANIVNNPSKYPLFTSNTDNGQLKFYDLVNDRYPFYLNGDFHTAIYMEKTFVDLLKSLNDVRLFSFADKAPNYANLQTTDFKAYGGAKGSAVVSDNNAQVLAGEVSKINPRYYNDPVNEPSVAIGYAELQFILAEGAVRGWIPGNAANFYNNGILASFSFYNIDQATAQAYIKQPGVQFPGTNQLQAIITQKYLNSFLNNGWQAFYDQRRTGFPIFDVSGDGVGNNKMVPKRFMYPQSELQLNTQNVSVAITRQFPQGDDINGVMWLLKTE
jgi:hypothetical protein